MTLRHQVQTRDRLVLNGLTCSKGEPTIFLRFLKSILLLLTVWIIKVFKKNNFKTIQILNRKQKKTYFLKKVYKYFKSYVKNTTRLAFFFY